MTKSTWKMTGVGLLTGVVSAYMLGAWQRRQRMLGKSPYAWVSKLGNGASSNGGSNGAQTNGTITV